jgi:23S rRNA (cytidine1920-2'-O)/16S rRNA (cytidine1409-2'-O)-methyltransferase
LFNGIGAIGWRDYPAAAPMACDSPPLNPETSSNLRQDRTSPERTQDASSQRLDQALVARGLVETRAKARDLILRGQVLVRGGAVLKPSQAVHVQDVVTLTAGHVAYVSRGALKLIGGLDAFGFEPAGRIAIDVGASTGGFTEVLLARGACSVLAVDVGHGQLHARLVADARVTNLEATDARRLTRDHCPGPITAIVSDVSFISLIKALPAALALASPGCWLVALIKPQFEAGLGAVGKGGIVRDLAVHDRVIGNVRQWLSEGQSWQIAGVVASPLTGGDGNQEYLLGAIKP